MGKILLALWVCVLSATALQGCGWLGSGCKGTASEIALAYNAKAQKECPEAWPDIRTGKICKPDQPCPQCPAIEAGDKAIDEACGL